MESKLMHAHALMCVAIDMRFESFYPPDYCSSTQPCDQSNVQGIPPARAFHAREMEQGEQRHPKCVLFIAIWFRASNVPWLVVVMSN